MTQRNYKIMMYNNGVQIYHHITKCQRLHLTGTKSNIDKATQNNDKLQSVPKPSIQLQGTRVMKCTTNHTSRSNI
jgi:hypothetical protein